MEHRTGQNPLQNQVKSKAHTPRSEHFLGRIQVKTYDRFIIGERTQFNAVQESDETEN